MRQGGVIKASENVLLNALPKARLKASLRGSTDGPTEGSTKGDAKRSRLTLQEDTISVDISVSFLGTICSECVGSATFLLLLWSRFQIETFN